MHLFVSLLVKDKWVLGSASDEVSVHAYNQRSEHLKGIIGIYFEYLSFFQKKKKRKNLTLYYFNNTHAVTCMVN